MLHHLKRRKRREDAAAVAAGGGDAEAFLAVELGFGDGVVEVKATDGDTHLGGDNIDDRLMEWIITDFKKESGIDLGNDNMAKQRLKEAAEKAKIELSTLLETEVNLPFITADATGPKHLQTTITRAQFEQMCDGLVERCRGPVVQALKDAKLDPKDIDEVVLVGGSTRIPKVQELVKKLFSKEPTRG